MSNPILETSTATVAANILVNLFKFAVPTAASSVLVVVALVAGIGATFLVSVSSGSTLSSAEIATNVIQGIIAAAAAAGIDRAGQAAQAKRDEASAASAESERGV